MEHSAILQLRKDLERGIFCSGVCPVPTDKTILYYGVNEPRRLNLSEASEPELMHLTETCTQATFGRGQEDVLDETYRKAKKLDLQNFATTFDLNSTGIMDVVAAHLLDGSNENDIIRPELYKLNVYDKGSFFKAHKDTPRGGNMFASLVIIFATAHKGGSLILRHDNQEWAYDSADELASLSAPSVGYVTFYSDIEHEVAPVTAGHRVTLTYNLYLEDRTVKSPKLANQPSSNFGNVKDNLATLLADKEFLPEGGLIGFGLRHQYPIDTLEKSRNFIQIILQFLKGSDKVLYNACKELSLQPCARVAYTSSSYYGENSLVLADHIVESGGMEDDSSPFLWELALEKGSILAKIGEDLDGYGDAEDMEEVIWITPITSYNHTEADFSTYGNEPGVGYVYGNFCLVCEIGAAGERV
ncbi:hypothetical protein VKT23_009804 [Stygiomarasmius scandens]|uniref:Fe2OG dioxygenase domain-containing protein n=1 Tax=Marasmiellus scandens TaxID=2682957 RepID=A0ABR1JDC6_9AGAR